MKCTYTKSNGKKCRSNAMQNSAYCWYHNPDIGAEEKKLVSSRGGRSESKLDEHKFPEIVIKDAKDIQTLVIDTIQNVRNNFMEVRKGSTLGYLSYILIKAYEVSDIESRIEKIEDRLDTLNPLKLK